MPMSTTRALNRLEHGTRRPGPLPPGEPELLARLRDGDAEACEEMVRAQAPRMLALARRLMGDEDLARDAVQDSFLAAFRALSAFHGEAALATWLHRITVNACLMRIRSRARHPDEPIEPLLPMLDAGGRHALPVDAPASAPEGALLRREKRQAVRAAIDRLPEKYRTVLLLRDVEELDTAEVAQMLSLTSTAVKVRLHRARQALRTLLTRPDRGH